MRRKKSFDQHVVPRSGDRWAVKREGAKRASKVVGMKHAAVHDAHHKAEKHDATMYVHGRSGKIVGGTSEPDAPFTDIINMK